MKKAGLWLLFAVLLILVCFHKIILFELRDPHVAIEKYLEKRYDDEFTVISKSSEDTFNFYWNKTSFSATFTSEKYPGKLIKASASKLQDEKGYRFWDNYLKRIYVDELDEIMVRVAENYFTGEYYVYTYSYGKAGVDTDPVLSFEEYVADDYHFGVCIFVEDMDRENALEAMEGFRSEIVEKGILCNFYVGKINQEDISKEEFLQEMEEKGEEFNPWYDFGSICYTNWYYRECEGEVVNRGIVLD